MKGLVVLALLGLLAFVPEGRFRAQSGEPFSRPSWEHPFGTDDLGRDLLTGVLEGARLSIVVGFGVAALALVLGAAVGVASGFWSGLVDEALMRLIELFQILPRFFLALTVVSIWGFELVYLVLVLGLTSWSGLARLARAETLAVKEHDFVLSARASGAKAGRIVARHVLPHVLPAVVAVVPLVASQAMLTEAGLSFLGLGTLPQVSWGYLLHNAQPFLRDAWWMAFFPGLSLTLTILALALAALVSRDVRWPSLFEGLLRR